MKRPAIYILTNRRNGTLYVGVTSDLPQRIWQHKSALVDGFSKKYKLHMLVYFEQHADMYSAISREKELKGMLRRDKILLIEDMNPYWSDLYASIV